MKIRFVNHACFIIEHDGVSIINDPWLEGRVFNNGWDFISPTRFRYEEFEKINYIWFSHEHPDHFYPPNLKKIDAGHKKNITVLFQKTIDGRVVEYCRKANFKEIIEMEKGTWYDLAPGFKALCEHFSEGDSWICYRVGGLTVLNTNDCGIRNRDAAEHIKNLVGDVDILLTQFSYAYWAGNRDEVEYRQKIADEKLEWVKFQTDIYKPKVTIPIASYIYFCHEENFYLNDAVNTARKTYKYLSENTDTTTVILYNDEEYEFGQAHDNEKSIRMYEDDFANIKANQGVKLEKNVPKPAEEITGVAKEFVNDLRKNNSPILKMYLRDCFIHLWDLRQSYRLSLKDGLILDSRPESGCDVSLSSESLLFCINFPYGLDTTQINGRLQKPRAGNYTRFYNFFRVNHLKSRGIKLNLDYLLGSVFNKFLVRLKLRQV